MSEGEEGWVGGGDPGDPPIQNGHCLMALLRRGRELAVPRAGVGSGGPAAEN